MLPINAFIKVAFLVFSSFVGKFGSNPNFPKKKMVPETGAWISLLLLLLLASIFWLL
jgi:hypothetical protein